MTGGKHRNPSIYFLPGLIREEGSFISITFDSLSRAEEGTKLMRDVIDIDKKSISNVIHEKIYLQIFCNTLNLQTHRQNKASPVISSKILFLFESHESLSYPRVSQNI